VQDHPTIKKYKIIHQTKTKQREETMATYKIVRFYAPHLHKEKEVIKTGLTLEEAQEHCSDPETSVKGVYFDGYYEE